MSHVKLSDSYSFTWLGHKSAHGTLTINIARFEMLTYLCGRVNVCFVCNVWCLLQALVKAWINFERSFYSDNFYLI